MNARFWTKVRKTKACWLWLAGLDGHGYGKFTEGGRQRAAHRLAYEALVGPIPAGMQLDHLCRTRRCVNPAHLEPVTNRENAARGDAGMARAAQQLAKTHCPAGHPFAGDNVQFRPDGRRRCRECRRAQRHKKEQ